MLFTSLNIYIYNTKSFFFKSSQPLSWIIFFVIFGWRGHYKCHSTQIVAFTYFLQLFFAIFLNTYAYKSTIRLQHQLDY